MHVLQLRSPHFMYMYMLGEGQLLTLLLFLYPSIFLTVENHPYLQQPLLKKYCNSKGIVLEAYSPLGNPARPFVVAEDPVVMEDPAIKELAAKHSVSAAQVSTMFTDELTSVIRFLFSNCSICTTYLCKVIQRALL